MLLRKNDLYELVLGCFPDYMVKWKKISAIECVLYAAFVQEGEMYMYSFIFI